MVSKKESRAATRRGLLDAGYAVFVERGFERATIEEIAARAGFTRGAFYWNFNSKTELLLEVIRDRVAQRGEESDGIAASASGPDDFNEVQRTRSRRRSRERRDWAIFMLDFWLLASRDQELRNAAATLKAEQRRRMARQLTDLADRGDVTLPAPVEKIASWMMALQDGLALQELLDPASIGGNSIYEALALLIRLLTTSP